MICYVDLPIFVDPYVVSVRLQKLADKARHFHPQSSKVVHIDGVRFSNGRRVPKLDVEL